jgi:hypothetical protein
MPIEDELNTIVVPAREDGFRNLYIQAGCWYPIRIGASKHRNIRYIAVYRVAPISSITHVAPVKVVERWNRTGKFNVVLSGPASEIGPVKLDRQGRVKALQSARYTSFSKLQIAKTLDDLW